MFANQRDSNVGIGSKVTIHAGALGLVGDHTSKLLSDQALKAGGEIVGSPDDKMRCQVAFKEGHKIEVLLPLSALVVIGKSSRSDSLPYWKRPAEWASICKTPAQRKLWQNTAELHRRKRSDFSGDRLQQALVLSVFKEGQLCKEVAQSPDLFVDTVELWWVANKLFGCDRETGEEGTLNYIRFLHDATKDYSGFVGKLQPHVVAKATRVVLQSEAVDAAFWFVRAVLKFNNAGALLTPIGMYIASVAEGEFKMEKQSASDLSSGASLLAALLDVHGDDSHGASASSPRVAASADEASSSLKQDIPPLITAFVQQKLRFAKILLEHGADLNAVDPTTGDTPLHVAVRTLRRDPPKLEQAVRMLMKRGPLPELKVSALHLSPVVLGPTFDLTHRLFASQNKRGETGVGMMKQKRLKDELALQHDEWSKAKRGIDDREMRAAKKPERTERAKVANAAHSKNHPGHEGSSASSNSTAAAMEASDEPLKEDSSSAASSTIKRARVDEVRSLIRALITGENPPVRPIDITAVNDGEDVSEGEDEGEEGEHAKIEKVPDAEESPLKPCAVNDKSPPTQNLDIEEFRSFDQCTWEIEFSETVRRWLKKRAKKSRHLIVQVFRRLQTLASGVWNEKNCKRLVGSSGQLTLYEAKLDSAQRIIWERAISFSERLSGAGPIFSQVIRVWEIVEDHDNLHRAIEQIRVSHRRGRDCYLKRSLRGIEAAVVKHKGGVKIHTPRTFRPADSAEDHNDDESKDTTLSKTRNPAEVDDDEVHYPPASPVETQYTILKFFDLNAKTIMTTLRGGSAEGFKMTDKEFDIVNWSPERKSSLLLLGRSGTGKTTCLVYRMYALYAGYWTMPTPALHLSAPAQSDEAGETSEVADCVSVEEHLHQVFITKSSVLRSEVEKNFFRLREQCKHELRLPGEWSEAHGISGLETLSGTPDTRFPLFISEKEWLYLLDAALGGEKFLDTRGGTSTGMTTSDSESGSLVSIAMYYDGIEEGEDEESAQLDIEGLRGSAESREVNFARFHAELWPKLKAKVATDLSSSLVWTEFYSFIKGRCVFAC